MPIFFTMCVALGCVSWIYAITILKFIIMNIPTITICRKEFNMNEHFAITICIENIHYKDSCNCNWQKKSQNLSWTFLQSQLAKNNSSWNFGKFQTNSRKYWVSSIRMFNTWHTTPIRMQVEFWVFLHDVCQQANDEETYIHKMSMSIIDGKLWVILLFCIGCCNICHTQFIFATRTIIEDY